MYKILLKRIFVNQIIGNVILQHVQGARNKGGNFCNVLSKLSLLKWILHFYSELNGKRNPHSKSITFGCFVLFNISNYVAQGSMHWIVVDEIGAILLQCVQFSFLRNLCVLVMFLIHLLFCSDLTLLCLYKLSYFFQLFLLMWLCSKQWFCMQYCAFIFVVPIPNFVVTKYVHRNKDVEQVFPILLSQSAQLLCFCLFY